jgi:hypothetical protein
VGLADKRLGAFGGKQAAGFFRVGVVGQNTADQGQRGIETELGFVGLAGATAAEEDFAGLLIAICFHQFFEGVSLGSRLSDASMSFATDVIFALIYAASAPVGIGIGIGSTAAASSRRTSTSSSPTSKWLRTLENRNIFTETVGKSVGTAAAALKS